MSNSGSVDRLPLHSQRAAVVLAVGSSAFGVAMAVLAHRVGKSLDFRIIVFGRALIALAIAYVVARRAGCVPTVRAPASMWLRSVLGAAIMCASFYAFTVLPPSDVVVVLNASPLWLAMLTWALLGHSIHGRTVVAIGLGFAGVIALERPHFGAANGALLLTVVAGAGMAFVTLLIARLRAIPSPFVVTHFVAVTLVLSAVLCLLPLPRRITSSDLASVSTITLLGLVGIGVTGAISQLLFTRACQLGRSTRVAVASVSQVPMTLAVDLAMGTRSFDALTVIGTVLVVAPVVYLVANSREAIHAVIEPFGAPGSRETERTETATRRLLESIVELERATSCELRIHVAHEPIARVDTAVRLFEKLRVEGTRRRNGLLIVVWPAVGSLAIVADEGISDVVSRRTLARSVRDSSSGADDWIDSVARVSSSMTDALKESFPPLDDANELPDDVTWGSA